jgi:tripartite-type tricarboxylate transporter receptor subunit TctC
MSHRCTVPCCALLAALAVAVSAAHAQASYPNKPIRLLVPFAPGGGTDIVARALAQKLTEAFKQSVVVDNRAGGGGTIGAELAVRATPDGYTMIMVSGSYSTNAALYKLPYDPVNDITPLALIGETGFVVSLHPGVPIKTVRELIDHAKGNPQKLNYGSTGTGGITHLASELFDMMAGTKMTHVPYKGTGPLMTDLIAGQVSLTIASAVPLIPQVKAGKLRGLATTGARRSAALPDLPTIGETVRGYEVTNWFGIVAPAGTPRAIVARINQAINKALERTDVKELLISRGADPGGGSPEEFARIIRADSAKWGKVVKASGARVD